MWKFYFGFLWEWNFVYLFLVTIFSVLKIGLFFHNKEDWMWWSHKPNLASDTYFLIKFPTKNIFWRVIQLHKNQVQDDKAK